MYCSKYNYILIIYYTNYILIIINYSIESQISNYFIYIILFQQVQISYWRYQITICSMKYLHCIISSHPQWESFFFLVKLCTQICKIIIQIKRDQLLSLFLVNSFHKNNIFNPKKALYFDMPGYSFLPKCPIAMISSI